MGRVIDIREKEGDLGRNLSAVADLVTALGEAESLRQKRAQTQNVLDMLGQGKTIDEISGQVSGGQPAEFDPGFSGILQRIASPFAAQPDPLDAIQTALGVRGQQSVIAARDARTRAGADSQALEKRLTSLQQMRNRAIDQFGTVTDQRLLDFADRGIDVVLKQIEGIKSGAGAGTVAGPGGVDVQGGQDQKKVDSENVRTLISFNTGRVDGETADKALVDLDNSPNFEVFTRDKKTDRLFSKTVKRFSGLREEIEQVGPNDKINGDEVYFEAVKAVMVQAARTGKKPVTAMAEFNRWWDENFAKEADQRFKKFGDRRQFEATQKLSDIPGFSGVAESEQFLTGPDQGVNRTGAFIIGQQIKRSGRTFEVTGFDNAGQPLFDEI